MKQRTFEQITQSKAIYRKHAERYKTLSDDQQDRKAKRMLAYTAHITKAIASLQRR